MTRRSTPPLAEANIHEKHEPLLDLTEKFVLSIAVLGWLALCGAFVYKVWNERQMTREYHAQAVEQKRIADVLEFFAQERAK